LPGSRAKKQNKQLIHYGVYDTVIHLQQHTSHFCWKVYGYNSVAVGLGCDSVWHQNKLFCSLLKNSVKIPLISVWFTQPNFLELLQVRLGHTKE